MELSSEGLYDTQMLSITVNTTELDVDHLPTFVVEWGERQSRTFTFPELLENTSKRSMQNDQKAGSCLRYTI